MAGEGIEKRSDVAAKKAAPKEKPYKLAGGRGLYLEVMPNGSKCWRLKFRFGGKEKRLAIGVYPETTLKAARKATSSARDKLAEGTDPTEIKRKEKLARSVGAGNSFQVVALEWLKKEQAHWSASHTTRQNWISERKLFPRLGRHPIAKINPPELLAVLRRAESAGKLETASRAQQVAGQIFRYAVATGRAERDPTPDLKGALATPIEKHLAAITDPKEVGALLRAIDGFSGTVTVSAALKLSPLLFCRPGELRQMEWAEINWEEGRWELPAEKMKMRLPQSFRYRLKR